MILEEYNKSGLLNNKKEENMEYENKSHNVVYPVAYGGYGDRGNDNNRFLEALIFLGLVDRNGNRACENATKEQVQHLATTTGLSDVTIKSKLDALQISTCEQTSTLKDSIYSSSTQNLVGLNAVGEKVTGVGYRVESNAKDIEKTILIDGGLTRNNDDKNAFKNLEATTTGFFNVKDTLCHLESNLTAQNSAHDSKMSAEHCDIKGLIKDIKYDITREIEAKGNAIIAQNSNYHHIEMEKMTAIDTNAIITNKNDQIRVQEMENIRLRTQADIARDANLQKEIEELKCDKRRDTEINILSKNIGSAIGSEFNGFRRDCREHFDRQNVLIGNTLQVGLRNNNDSNGNGNGHGHGN